MNHLIKRQVFSVRALVKSFIKYLKLTIKDCFYLSPCIMQNKKHVLILPSWYRHMMVGDSFEQAQTKKKWL